MVLRELGDGALLAIGQASHAWLSGQLARAWGNDRFPAPSPREAVCLGAEQHDVGMAEWDLRPTLDPATGRPHGFMDMPLRTHLELWSRAPQRMLAQSRYAALLVSLHGTGLYERRDLGALAPSEAGAVRAHLAAQRALQERLLAALRDDPATAAAAAPERVERNRRLIWAWDFLSLAICLDWAPCRTPALPAAGGSVEGELRPAPGGGLTLDPWPFGAAEVTVRCEGRRLAGRFESEREMRAALAAAPWATLEVTLAR